MAEMVILHQRVVSVDDEDVAMLSEYKWRPHMNGSKSQTYAITTLPREPGARHQKLVLMHNMITGQKGIDHIDRNGLNNQRSNLRPASARQQAHNQTKRRGCSSPFRGVSWNSREKMWRAQYTPTAGNQKLLGRFADELEAARAYDRAAKEAYGEYALLNFPEAI